MKARIVAMTVTESRALYQHLDTLRDLSRKDDRARDGLMDTIEEAQGAYFPRVEAIQKRAQSEFRRLSATGDQAAISKMRAGLDDELDALEDELGHDEIELVVSEDQYELLKEKAGTVESLRGDRFELNRETRRLRDAIIEAIEDAAHAKITENEEGERVVERIAEDEAIPEIGKARERREQRKAKRLRAAGG